MNDYALTPARQTTISIRTLLLLVMLVTMLFDFRRAEGDQGGFVVMLGLANMLFGALLMLHINHLRHNALAALTPLILFLVVTATVGFLRDQSAYQIVARSVPLLIYLFAGIGIAHYARNIEEVNSLLNMLVIFCLLTALWKLFFAFAYYGLSLETIRYRALSGATPMLFCYALTSFLLGGRRFAAFALVLSLGVVAVSVTRTYILVFAISSLIGLICLPSSRIGRAIPSLGIGLLLLVFCAIAIQIIAPEVVQNWIIRLTARERAGFDLTAATRLAEAAYQIQRLGDDPLGLFFGFGPVAETRFAGSNAILVQSVLGERGLNYNGHGYGHNFYVGLIYVGGLLAGGLMILSLLSLLMVSIAQARVRLGRTDDTAAFMLLWGVTTFAGYLAYSAVGGTFGDRSMSFFFGLSTGLVLAGLHWTKQRD